MKDIRSHEEMLKALRGSKRAYLLLYKAGSEQSECALQNFREASVDQDEIILLAADVSKVRDIHGHYGIDSAPSVLEFKETEFKNVIKGCHDKAYLTALIENAVYTASASDDEQPAHSVTVYTTPTCSWCGTLKTHLRKHRIQYTELDVSKDENALKEMMNKSGQQGVPQTDIDGHMIIGFDKVKINQLLEIQG